MFGLQKWGQMTSEQITSVAMQRRAAQGLKLKWFIPAENRVFTAYPKDEAQKQAWLAKAEAYGWVLQY
jgi:hypothetical protein